MYHLVLLLLRFAFGIITNSDILQRVALRRLATLAPFQNIEICFFHAKQTREEEGTQRALKKNKKAGIYLRKISPLKKVQNLKSTLLGNIRKE